MGAAKASTPGSKVVSVYISSDLWDAVRRDAFDNATSASALIVAKLEEHMAASTEARAATLERARAISVGRRKRAD